MNATEIQSGTVIDRYTVRRVLGEGGMAIVFEVQHNQLGSLHALKVLTLANKQVRERLLLEGRAQAALKHPNVVTVTDVIDMAGVPGLVMEFIEGPSLDDYLDRQRLTVAQVDHLARGILAGVAAAHDAGLVHRDLKPANIMLAIGSGGLVPKVTDFGLAKIVATDGAMSKTRTGATMGTPHYMSPEQIDDAKNVGPATDIWALGAILYEMLTGERAFPGDNLLAIFSAVDKVDYVPVRAKVPDVPERMAQAIEAALSRDPTARPPTVQALYALWAGDTLADTAASSLLGPWDAEALASARAALSTVAEPTRRATEGTLARSDSLVRSRAAWIGLGGGLLGLGGLGVALVALLAMGGFAWWLSQREPEVRVVEKRVEVEVPVEVPVVAPVEPVEAAGEPVPGELPPPPGPKVSPAPGAPAGSTDEEPAVAEVEVPEEVVEPEVEEEATAEVEVPVEGEAAEEGEIFLGLLDNPDPAERLASIARQLPQADEDTSRRLYALILKEHDATVRTAAIEAVITLWDDDRGHADTNRDAVVYAMGLGERDATKAAAAFGRNGRDPDLLKRAMTHDAPGVRRAAVDAFASVAPRAKEGYNAKAAIQPLTLDPDPSVAKRAQKVLDGL